MITGVPKAMPDTYFIFRKATKAEINRKILKICFIFWQKKAKCFVVTDKYCDLLNARDLKDWRI